MPDKDKITIQIKTVITDDLIKAVLIPAIKASVDSFECKGTVYAYKSSSLPKWLLDIFKPV